MGTKTKRFTSAMTGAPVLSGTAGSLIAVLDAVLVNGFGTQAVSSLVVVDGVATANVPTAPSAEVGSVILVAGATPAGLNGEQRVTAVLGNSVTFATALSNQTATGTITIKAQSAGWGKQFSGTNLAVYKMGGVMGTGCVLHVDDTGTTVARVKGAEAMTAVSAGVGYFPSVAQYASGLWWSKSNAASAAARAWQIVADETGFYFFVKNADSAAEYQGNFFGDFLPIKSNDPYSCVLRANSADQSTSVAAITDGLEYADPSQAVDGMYCARAANTLGGAIKAYQAPVMSVGLTPAHITGSVGWGYPSPVDNGLMLTPVLIYSTAGFRGYFPGLRYSPQLTNTAFSTGDNIAGSGDMLGKSVQVVKLGATAAGASQGVVFVDSTSDWR